MSRFESLESFIAVVDMQGFSPAADKLGIAKSMVSRRVSDLENRLGVQLLNRTTRRQSLTEAGREFYQRASQILDDLNEAEEYASSSDCAISGRIKLALPQVLGTTEFTLPVSQFMHQHPDIRIDVDLNDRQVDLVEANIDLAIRIGNLQDSSLVARKLCDFHFSICASPAYLEQFGVPQTPQDLSQHELLVYSNVTPARQWTFEYQGKSFSPRVSYRLSANSGDFLANMARQGLGVVSGPVAYLREHISSGGLIPVLQEYTPPATGIYALYPPGRRISRRVKMLSDSLYEYFKGAVPGMF